MKLRHQAQRDAESIRPQAERLLERLLSGKQPDEAAVRAACRPFARRDAPRRRPPRAAAGLDGISAQAGTCAR